MSFILADRDTSFWKTLELEVEGNDRRKVDTGMKDDHDEARLVDEAPVFRRIVG